MLYVVKVSSKSDRKVCFGPAAYLPFTRSLILAVSPPNAPFSFSTNQASFTECSHKCKRKEKPGCLFGGVSHCLGQASN